MNYKLASIFEKKNMDNIRTHLKEANETSQSFTNRREPLQERQMDNLPFVTQIQDSLAVLVRKRNQLRELKILSDNFKSKGQDQELRIEALQIEMDHHIEKEESNRQRTNKLERETFWYKETVRELLKQLQFMRHEIKQSFVSKETLKANIEMTRKRCGESEDNLAEKEHDKAEIEQQIISLEQVISKSENLLRQKQDFLTNLKLQETQMNSVMEYMTQRAMSTLKARNKTIADNKLLEKQISLLEAKKINAEKQIQEMEWSFDRIAQENDEVDELNHRLLEDLEAVQKHLMTIDKANKMLKDSLEEFGITGEKVTRMINMVKTDY